MDNPPRNIRNIVKRIRDIMTKLHSCVLEHCYREVNSLAYVIPDISTNIRMKGINVADLPNVCNNVIENDKRGKLYKLCNAFELKNIKRYGSSI